MYFRQGKNWSLGVCANPQMLMALYLRELGGIAPADVGPNCGLKQASKLRARHRPNSPGEIRQEWYSWWNSLVNEGQGLNDQKPTDLLRNIDWRGYPELARLAAAHYGQIMLFAHECLEDFETNSSQYIPQRMDEVQAILERQAIEPAAEHGPQHIQFVDIPLNEPRAWLAGNATVVASTSLLRDGKAFHGYIEPIVSIIFV